jgi:hypothetical protein
MTTAVAFRLPDDPNDDLILAAFVWTLIVVLVREFPF